MTNEEAIKGLQNIINDWTYRPDEVEIAKLAIKAIEKQIPKKPIKSDREIQYCEVWKCPKCGFEFSGRVVEYCYRCGQKIDWRL